MKAGWIAWSVATALPFCAAQAGEPPTARIMVNPVPAKVGPPYPPLADGGPNIVGNELRLDAGGVRVWVEVQIADWDPNGDGSPGANFFQVTLDGTGLLDADIDDDGDVADDGDQEDIALATIPCISRADCWAAIGEALPDVGCSSGTCLPVYTDKGGFRSDGWCAGGGNCSCGSHPIIAKPGWTVFGCYDDGVRPDDGTVRWGATAVYDVPSSAKGMYAVVLNMEQTWLRDGSSPPHDIPTLSETGFFINILTGRCCFGSGTPLAGCVEGVTRGQCAGEPAPVRFTPEERCPPEGAICATVTGACCDGDPFVPCVEDVAISACPSPGAAWTEGKTCDQIDCPRTAIPAVSTWGLVSLILGLMILAKIAFGAHRAEHAVQSPSPAQVN